MFFVLNDIIYLDKAIEMGKKGIPIKFIRDGTHSEKDLEVIAKFKQEGFLYDIRTFKGTYEENAICVDFHFVSEKHGYI